MLSLQSFINIIFWSFVCFLSHTVSVSLFPFSWIISINVECNWYVTFLTLSRHNKNWKCAPCDKNCYKTIVSSFACNSLSVGYNTLLCDNFYYVKWTLWQVQSRPRKINILFLCSHQPSTSPCVAICILLHKPLKICISNNPSPSPSPKSKSIVQF